VGIGERKGSEARVALSTLICNFGGAATLFSTCRAAMRSNELLSTLHLRDADAFKQANAGLWQRASVFTAPACPTVDLNQPRKKMSSACDWLCTEPIRFRGPRHCPAPLVTWTETVLTLADVYYPWCSLTCARQNCASVLEDAEGRRLYPIVRKLLVMNRSPRFYRSSGRTRMKRMAEKPPYHDWRKCCPMAAIQLNRSQ